MTLCYLEFTMYEVLQTKFPNLNKSVGVLEKLHLSFKSEEYDCYSVSVSNIEATAILWTEKALLFACK